MVPRAELIVRSDVGGGDRWHYSKPERARLMKLHLIALLIVLVLTTSMATAVYVYGAHSTPGIRFLMLNVPGVAVAVWVGSRIRSIGENNFVFYAIAAAVNWVFYFYLVSGAALLKRKLSN